MFLVVALTRSIQVKRIYWREEQQDTSVHTTVKCSLIGKRVRLLHSHTHKGYVADDDVLEKVYSNDYCMNGTLKLV